MNNEIEYEQIMELEDFLQERNVFLGKTGESAHMDSYGTVVDFNRLMEVWETAKTSYPAWVLEQVIAYWKNQQNSVCARIIGGFLSAITKGAT